MARLLCGTLTDPYSNMCAMHPTGTLVNPRDADGNVMIKIMICLSKNSKSDVQKAFTYYYTIQRDLPARP